MIDVGGRVHVRETVVEGLDLEIVTEGRRVAIGIAEVDPETGAAEAEAEAKSEIPARAGTATPWYTFNLNFL